MPPLSVKQRMAVQPTRILALARANAVMVVVLIVALLVRVLATVAYWPALFYTDSFAYMGMAYGATPVAFQPDRPSGYPLLIKLLTILGHQLAVVTVAQHVAGLATGVLVYICLVRLGTRRWLAGLAAAVVLLDANLIVLEQWILAESFFTLFVMLSMYLAAVPPVTVRRTVMSGAFLAIAVMLRNSALFVVPVWLIFVASQKVGWRGFGACALGLLAPLLLYGAVQAVTGYGSALQTSNGWFLYGRVAGFANCRDRDISARLRPLCPTGDQRGHDLGFYLWQPNSPAHRVFATGPTRFDPHANSLLFSFAVAVIRDQPLDYLRTVTDDVEALFEGNGSLKGSPPSLGAAVSPQSSPYRHKLFTDDFSSTVLPRVQSPAALMGDYRDDVHTQGWLLMSLTLISLLVIMTGVTEWTRQRVTRRREVFLFSGGAFALIVGAIATAWAGPRYLLVAIPPLICGGTLACEELWRAVRSVRAAPRTTLPSRTAESSG